MHNVQHRERLKTKDGTQQLIRTAQLCDKARGVVVPHASIPIPYSRIAHRTLIALRCAVNHRPFEIVQDPFYIQEMQMLHPGIQLPSPKTVSRDVQRLYKGLGVYFQQYIRVSDTSLRCTCSDSFSRRT
ncbi:hypothetical protein EV121DRAFT_218878 [Schizophyllum commune]